MPPWHMRHARPIVYAAGAAAMAAVAVVAWTDSADPGVRLVTARQLFGLWALGLVLASMLVGPLTAVLPWFPLRPTLMYARRAVGVTALYFALAHVGCYLWSLGRRDWRELYTPGWLWVAGLALGAVALADLIALGWTSRDAAVKRLGGRRWKRLHATLYVTLFVLLAHALLVGADFGLRRGPDVVAEADFGAGIAFAGLSVAWVTLFLLRRGKARWTPAFVARRRQGVR